MSCVLYLFRIMKTRICCAIVSLLAVASSMNAQTKVTFETDFKNVSLEKNMTRIVGATEDVNLKINFESSDREKAWAEICKAPNRRGLNALHFQFRDVNVLDENGNEKKGRIQNEFGAAAGFRHFVNEVDVFLPEEMRHLLDYSGKIGWFTLQEYWNDVYNAPDGKVFRMTIGMLKDKGAGKDLYFNLRSEDNYGDGWVRINDFHNDRWKIPFGKWFTIRTEITEGGPNTGRFKVQVRKKGSLRWVTIFDEQMQTWSSKYNDGVLTPDGINSLQMLKFYTSKEVINFMAENGHTLDIYFTNWKFKGIKYE